MEIAFVGAGAMARAIVSGLVSSRALPPTRIHVSSEHGLSARNLAADTGICSYPDTLTMLQTLKPQSLVVLAVKPHKVPSVLTSISGLLIQQQHILVSIAAGVEYATLKKLVSGRIPVIRVMPNLNVQCREGISAIYSDPNTATQVMDYVAQVFQSVGEVVEVPEQLFPAFTALGGSSPAWTAQYIDALALGGVELGLPKEIAVRIAAQAVLGTAKSILEGSKTGSDPSKFIDSVQSPGGTTIAGTVALHKSGFTAATVAAVQACYQRDLEISKGK